MTKSRITLLLAIAVISSVVRSVSFREGGDGGDEHSSFVVATSDANVVSDSENSIEMLSKSGK